MNKFSPSSRRRIFETGTTEPNSQARKFQVGDISATIDAGALRRLAFGPIELVRQIDFPVRDQNWSTYPPLVTGETLDEQPGMFRYQRCFDVGSGALSCIVTYEVQADGRVNATAEATAARDFTTNRTGFSLLHPIAGVSGRPVDLTTSAGTVETVSMPDTISPSQPIKDIAGLAFSIDGVTLDIAFSGDVFEMEDQRNWTDASFKTYSRPLVEPFAYKIKEGETVRQKIRLKISGTAEPEPCSASGKLEIGSPLLEALPEILLAAETDWLPDAKGTRLLTIGGFKALLLRTAARDAATDLGLASEVLQALSGYLDLEIVLDDRSSARLQLEQVAAACRNAGYMPRHIIALPASYLKSYQPTGKWPEGLSPRSAHEAARQVFPDARIGAGVLTNFTEFNRCRPNGLSCDFITHGNSAIVHAADDNSVAQTIDSLPDIFRSARQISGNLSYRLGLTAIGMRSNPYGEAVSSNPEQVRLTMARWDPRARALFGAAWAVSALAKTEGFGIDAVSLAAPVGPFGILATTAPVLRAWFDDHPEANVYPIFHALRFVATGGQRLKVTGVPPQLSAVAFATGSTNRLIVANLSGEGTRLELGVNGNAALLDAASFEAAVANPDWFESSKAGISDGSLDLASPSVLFIETCPRSSGKLSNSFSDPI